MFHNHVISVAGLVLSKISLIIVTGATLIVTECCSKTEINEIFEVKSGNYETHMSTTFLPPALVAFALWIGETSEMRSKYPLINHI